MQRLYLLDGAQIEGKFTDQEAKQLSEEAKVSQEFQEEASPEISLHAISGTLATQTMRLKGIINRPPVVVLIDSESVPNFIDLATARKTGQDSQGMMEVMVANGEKLNSPGCCKQVNLSIPGIPISTDFYLLDLEGFKVVLGAYWLQTLGPILWDFSNMWMKFTMNAKECQLTGNMRKGLEAIQPSKLGKTMKGRGALLQLCSIHMTRSPTKPDPQIDLLQEYNDIFKETKEHLPPRTQDHRIILRAGTSPLSIRPYRYPHYQKNEIEKLVKEMLESGIIRPN